VEKNNGAMSLICHSTCNSSQSFRYYSTHDKSQTSGQSHCIIWMQQLRTTG